MCKILFIFNYKNILSPTWMQQAKERFNRVIKEHYLNVDSISFNLLITVYINDINKNIKVYQMNLND